MQKKYVVILIIIGGLIAYMTGCLLPYKYFVFETTSEAISNTEYLKVILSIISIFITLSAVLVALFKEDIREYYNKPKLKFIEPEKITIEELSEYKTPGNAENFLEAEKYISRLLITNCGNTSATNVEIFLEKLEFKEANSTIVESFETSGIPLEWNGIKQNAINIPPGSTKTIDLVEIFSPTKTSTPSSKSDTEKAKIVIGKHDNSKKTLKGNWSATFSLHASNHKLISQKIEVEFKGAWKSRLAEFVKVYEFKKL